MSQCAITIVPDRRTEEFQVTLLGPGLDESGRQFIFRNPERAENFEDAINFAYQQGFRDGTREVRNATGRLWVVAGSHPDNLELRPEGLWARLRRKIENAAALL